MRDGARHAPQHAPWHAALSFSFMLKLWVLLDFIGRYWTLLVFNCRNAKRHEKKDTSSERSCLFFCLSLFVLALFKNLVAFFENVLEWRCFFI